jgi:Domain of unknown function (DUF1839)
VAVSLLPITAASYQRHPLHSSDRVWSETNCYVDVWIELLHALGLDPMVASAFATSTDFEGDQWTFFKFPPEDLRLAYGIDVAEMNVWRPVLDHIVEQIQLGRWLTVEVDSYFLPDTNGVSYQLAHAKSTIVANSVDVENRRLGYFHNAGYYELEGGDFDALFHLDQYADADALPPYVEVIKLDRLHRAEGADAAATASTLLREHLQRRAHDNPIVRMAARIDADLEWLRQAEGETFHVWAFGICRQCGASAELAATFLHWLAERDQGQAIALTAAAEQQQQLAEAAKSLQFTLARVARGRSTDIGPILDAMATNWQAASAALDSISFAALG